MEERELYVLPPKEFKRDGYLMHMKKAAYGFADAPRRWFMTSDKILRQIGFRSSSGDPATYFLQTEDKETKKITLNGMLCLHVDDGLCAGDEIFEKALRKYYQHFKVNPEKGSDTTVEYTGAEISKIGKNKISMSQKLYSVIIEKPTHEIDPSRSKLSDEKLNEMEKNALRQYCGMLGWPSVISRPDLASETNIIQTSMADPRISDLVAAEKLWRRLKSTGDSRLLYTDVRGTDETCLIMFSDASNHNLRDEDGDKTQSQAGWLLVEAELNENNTMPENPKANIIGWRSFKIKRTCRSSFAAETIAAVEAADALIFTAFTYEEMSGRRIKRFLAVDSMNLKTHTTQFQNTLAERRLKIDLYSLKENMSRGEITLLWVDGQENPADGLTKASSTALKSLLSLMRNCVVPVQTMSAWIGVSLS